MTAMTELQWGRIFAKAWSDPDFKAEFEADPRTAIGKHGEALGLPSDVKFSFPDMPDHITEEKAKSIAEGKIKPEPMYCC